MREQTPKQVVAGLINTWVKRAGVTKEQVAARANLADANELYRHYLDQSRNLSTNPAAAMAIVLAFRQNLPAQLRCTAAEAITFLILTQLPLDRYPEVQRAGGFSATEWQQALAAHDIVLAHDALLAPPPNGSDVLERLEQMEHALATHQQTAEARRVQELHAKLHDHTGFLQDRLASFVGRETELGEVRQRIAELLPAGGYVTITAPAGQGKSSLIARLVELALCEQCGAAGSLPIDELVRRAGPGALCYHFIPFSPGPDHQVGLLRNLMARLILKYGLSELYVASDSRPALRDYFASLLEEVAKQGGREVIYIDGLDQIEEDVSGVRDLSFLPVSPPAGIVFVLGTRPNDTLRPLELRKPHNMYTLPPLSRGDFDLILRHRCVRLSPVQAERFYHAMEANALYLDLAARELAEAAMLAPEQIIARVADNPEHLFSLAVERLKRPAQEWTTLVKPILGALLAAQQPLSAASLRAIIGEQDEAVRAALLRLGGLLSRDGEGSYSLFHLKLRDFLREDPQRPEKDYVFAVDEERGYHQQLAGWCERGGLERIWQDCPQDAREQQRRAYARQHLVTHLCHAQHWPRLWEVLDRGEYGRAKLRHDPSTRSLVLDLDLVRQHIAAAMREDPSQWSTWVPRLWRYSLLRCSLASLADRYPDGLIEQLARLGREQEAIGLAEVLTAPWSKVTTLVRIGVMLGDQGRVAEQQRLVFRAVEIARMVDQHSVINQRSMLKLVVRELAQAQRFEDAVATLQEIADTHLRAEALREVVWALAQAQRLEEATSLAQQITEAQPQAEALREVVWALAQAQRFEEATSLAQQITDAQPQITDAQSRAEALVRVVGALAQAQRFAEATNLAQEVIAIARSITTEPARASVLIELVKALVQAQWLEEAAALVEEVTAIARQIMDTEQRALLFAMIVEWQAQAQRLEEALRLAQETVVLARQTDVPKQISLLDALIQAFAQAQEIAQALSLAEQITNEQRRVDALRRVVGALAQAQRIAEALELAHQITDPRQRAYGIVMVVRELAQAQRIAEALTVIEQITHEDARGPAIAGVVRTLAQTQQFEQALALARQIPNQAQQTRAFMDVVQALIQAQKMEDVARVVQETTVIARRTPNEYARAQTFEVLVVALAKAGRINEALALAEQLTDEQKRMSALAEVVRALAKAQRLEEALALARQFTNQQRRDSMLMEVVRVFADAQRIDEALALARQFTDEQSRVFALVKVVEVFPTAQLIEEALVLAGQLSDERQRESMLVGVATGLAKAERIDEAIALARQIVHENIRVLALVQVAQRLMVKRTAEATLVVEEAASVAGGIADAQSRVMSLVYVVRPLVRVQQMEKASALAQEAFTLAQQIGEQQSASLEVVFGALVQTQQIEHAIVVAQQITDKLSRALALRRVVNALAQAQRFEEAFTLVERITDEKEREMVQVELVRVLARAQRIEEAFALVHQFKDTMMQTYALIEIAKESVLTERWDCVIQAIREVAVFHRILRRSSFSRKLPSIPHLPTTLALVEHLWSTTTTRDDLYEWLAFAIPLFVADTTLLPQILAGEEWVRAQLEW